jgi:RNA-binding protein
MKELSGSDKRRLKKLAHAMKPLIQVGKNGLSPNLFNTIDKALNDHELVKIRFLENKSRRREFSGEIAEKTSSELLQVIGNTALFYRESQVPSKRQKLLRKKSLPPPKKRLRRTPRG